MLYAALSSESEGLAHSKALNETEKGSKKKARSDRQSNPMERDQRKARTGAAARLSGRLRKTDGKEATAKGRGGGTAGETGPLHTADNQQQLGHALQVEAVGAVLGDVPRLRGTCGEKEEAIIMRPREPTTR